VVCTFYFSDNGTYTEAADVALGCLGTSATNTITFKPFTSVTCTITFTSTATASIDGNFVIGAANALNIAWEFNLYQLRYH
jgi:hypothetical protein